MKTIISTAFLAALLLICSCSDRTPPKKPRFFKPDPGQLSRFTSRNSKKLVEGQWDSITIGFYSQDEDGTYRRYYWKCADTEKLAALRSKFSSSITDIVLVGSPWRCYSHEMRVTISDSSRWTLCFSAANDPKDRYLSVFKCPSGDSWNNDHYIPTKVTLDYRLDGPEFYNMLTDMIVADFGRSISLTLNVDHLVYDGGKNVEALHLEGRGRARKVKLDYHWFSRMDDNRLVVSE